MPERLTTGVKLSVDKTTVPGGTFVELLEITEIDLPSESASSLDKTVLADAKRKFRPGLYDPGEVSFGFHFNPDDTNHLWLHDQVAARVSRAWRITIPADGAGTKAWNCDFVGFVTEFAPSAGGVDDFLTVSVTVKVSGDVTYAEATT